MSVAEFRLRVADLERVQDNVRARTLGAVLHERATYLRQFIDCRLHARANGALAGHRLPLLPTWVPSPLEVGETYVLLHFPPHGAVGRIQLSPSRGSALLTVSCRGDAGRFSIAAREGLSRLLQTRGCGRLEDICAPYHAELQWEGNPEEAVDGASIGLSVAIALLSRWLGRAPRHDTAATAEVDSEGTLKPVRNVGEKLRTLAVAWPGVRRVVVAPGQFVADVSSDIEFLFARDAVEAAGHFGLAVTTETFPATATAQLRARVNAFPAIHDETRASTDEWARLAQEARAIANHFTLKHPEGVRALGWAAMFALHAGDITAAEDNINQIPKDMPLSLDSTPRGWLLITRATILIDQSPADAVDTARAGLKEVAGMHGEAYRRLYGCAEGTLGRALMHAGRYSEAMPHLAEGVRHHKEHLPEEEARSKNYLATCARLSGDPTSGLRHADEALATLRTPCGSSLSAPMTRLYLELERGRCLIELSRFDDALAALEVACGQSRDHDYPRLGGLRGRAIALRRLGRSSEARRAMDDCRQVAVEMLMLKSESGIFLAQIATLAAGEALLDQKLGAAEDLGDIREWWCRHFPAIPFTPEQVSQQVKRSVY